MKSETTGKRAKQTHAPLSGFMRHPAVKALGVVTLALTLANCSSSNKSAFNKYGVKASPRVIADGQPVPKGGGRYQVGKPYVVAGRTYVPQESPTTQVGLASWYGSDFHGRLTANGEIFDQYAVAAAHPTMPLPSYARVTNLTNNRSMIVRVNDRGPYHADRVMDVSQVVADALDFKRSGTAKVKVEYVGRASLNGSDDKVLLASLRTDGLPAQMQRLQPYPQLPTALAAAQPQPVHQNALPQFRSPPQVATTPAISAPIPMPSAAPLPPQRPYIMGQGTGRTQIAGLARGEED